MSKPLKAVVLVVSALGWLTLLCSLSFSMFAFRVGNEPGAVSIPLYSQVAAVTFLTGSTVTFLVHYFFSRRKEKFTSLWIANLVASILYLPFFLLTLLLMV